MLKIFTLLVMGAVFMGQGFASDQKQIPVKMKKQSSPKISVIQSQFDALVIRVAKAGITDVKQLEHILNIELVPGSKSGEPDAELYLREKKIPKGSSIVAIAYARQFDPSDSREETALVSANLTIYYDPAMQLSAKNITDEYENPVYILNPGYKSLGYFYLNDTNVYLSYNPVSDFHAADDSNNPAVSEVVFTWDREHIKPKFSVLYKKDKKEVKQDNSGRSP
ncbi:hypothetical protein [Undibacterium sp. TS12]|uniref:hypothetical protein n=1 Tax=Undibacterium sp. TS12 TaxID=2908202 RepID=UPI001F4C8229|nr:hypothetical protein [Undibacterium sp. TS12]MCH8620405.1 hypothetical protein [Undibacterium sp. TS12]